MKTLKRLLPLLVLSFYTLSYSQTSNIDLYLRLENATTTSEKLKVVLKMEQVGFISKYSTISNYYYALGQNKKAFAYLKKAIQSGETLDREYVIASVPEQDLIRIKAEYKQLRQQFYGTFDEKMYNEIKYRYHADQYLSSENFYGGRKAQHPIRLKIFQNNLTNLRTYIIQNNNSQLPQYNQVGNATRDISVMLLHHTRLDSVDEVNYAFFEKVLKEEVRSRKSYSPYNYIQFVDNMQLVIEEGKLQVYGHHRNFKTNKICELKYPEEVDRLRAEIGLRPLKEYARINGFTLPDNYIEY
jgi:hypothetical protein